MTDEQRKALLAVPQGGCDVILDTDAYNEIDDQFAISYLIRSPELTVKAICAAPFYNERSTSPGDGMERSYAEIGKVLTLAGRTDLLPLVYRGAPRILASKNDAVDSPAVDAICAEAMAHSTENPLYLVSIGAATNVASALNRMPEIRERTVVVWLGGNAPYLGETSEFNLLQDRFAARVLLESGVPLVRLPCVGTVDRFTTTEPELRHWLVGKNPLATYLAENTIAAANQYAAGKAWSRVIWDVTAVAWLKNKNNRFMHCATMTTETFDDTVHWVPFEGAKICSYATFIKRDELMTDLFALLTK